MCLNLLRRSHFFNDKHFLARTLNIRTFFESILLTSLFNFSIFLIFTLKFWWKIKGWIGVVEPSKRMFASYLKLIRLNVRCFSFYLFYHFTVNFMNTLSTQKLNENNLKNFFITQIKKKAMPNRVRCKNCKILFQSYLVWGRLVGSGWTK